VRDEIDSCWLRISMATILRLPFLLLDAHFPAAPAAGDRRAEASNAADAVMEALFENSSKTKQRFDYRWSRFDLRKSEVLARSMSRPIRCAWRLRRPVSRLSHRDRSRIIAIAPTPNDGDARSLGRDADVFIAEAYYYDKIVKNHLALATLEAHLAEIRPKRLILTHMSDDMLGRLDTLGHTAASDA